MTRVEVALSEKVSSIPNKVCDEVMSHFVVNGAVPKSASQVTNLITNMQSQVLTEIRNEIRSLGKGYTVGNSVQGRNISDVSAQSGEASISFQFWTWGGRLCMVPEEFHFPSCNVRSLWDLWRTSS
jgi:hypothetical protein